MKAMKNIIFTSIMVLSLYGLKAQVGIGTTTPDNSAVLELSASDKGILFPRMTSVQRTSIASPASGLYVFDTNTNSLWYYNGTLWINTTAEASFGDVKSGFQAADHSGWIKLDGRAVNTLTPNQQAVAISLGFTTNLPDATTAYLVQDNGTMGATSGANTTTLTQANLPNVNFSGSAASAGGHNHGGATGNGGGHNHSGTTSTNGSHTHGSNATGANVGLAIITGGGTPSGIDNSSNEINNFLTPALQIYNAGNHNHTFTTSTVSDHSHNINTDGAHTHAVTVSSGGSATPINIAPRSLTVNMFVYLGQ